MMCRIMLILCCALFLNVSAMKEQSQQDQMWTLVRKLVRPGNEDSIIVFSFKTNTLSDKREKRRESETVLSDIALRGIRLSLLLDTATVGKKFLFVDNKVTHYEKNPACSQGLLVSKGMHGETPKENVSLKSTGSYNSSFIVYNMPYYKQDEGCFNWAYGEDLRDIICYRKEPCLILIDEDIYNKQEDIIDEIYRRFYGKKKILQYDKKSQSLTEYKPCLLSGTLLPTMVLWAAVATVGLYYAMPSGLASSMNTTF